MKKILVPTDLSPKAELGLKLAIEIATRNNAVISLVNFTRHPIGKTFSAMGDVTTKNDEEVTLYTLQLLHANKTKLDELVLKYESENVHIDYAILDDELKDGIDKYLHTEEIDLVVMGTSGEENIKEVFTGNHTEQVIQISACPVISVRDGFHIHEFHAIALAVDVMKDDLIIHALTSVVPLAQTFDATVHLVHARNLATDSTRNLNVYFTQAAEAAGLKKFMITILEVDDPAHGIIQFTREIKAGLIGVIKNGEDGVFKIFSSHFSNRLVKEVGRPVFTYNLQRALAHH